MSQAQSITELAAGNANKMGTPLELEQKSYRKYKWDLEAESNM